MQKDNGSRASGAIPFFRNTNEISEDTSGTRLEKKIMILAQDRLVSQTEHSIGTCTTF